MNRDSPYFRRVGYIALSPDGTLLAASNDYGDEAQAAIWDVDSGRLLGVHPGWALWMLPDSDQLVLQTRTTCHVVSVERGDVVAKLKGPPHLTADGQSLYTSTSTGRITFWDPAGGRTEFGLQDAKRIDLIQVSARRRTIASHDNRSAIALWDGTTGEKAHDIPHPTSPVGMGVGTAFAPSDQALWSAGSKTMASWDARSGEQLETIALDQDRSRLYLSPDGRRAIVAGSLKTISPVVCDLQPLAIAHTVDFFPHARGVHFSRTGEHAFLTGPAGAIRLSLDTGTTEVISEAECWASGVGGDLWVLGNAEGQIVLYDQESLRETGRFDLLSVL